MHQRQMTTSIPSARPNRRALGTIVGKSLNEALLSTGMCDDNHMTVVEYVSTYDANLLQFMSDPTRFADEELWMDFQEARLGLPPIFRADGQRVYHKLLIGWSLDVEVPARTTE